MVIPIILTSVAGGVISKAFIHEKIRIKYFREVIREGFILFLVALGFTILVAIVWAILLVAV